MEEKNKIKRPIVKNMLFVYSHMVKWHPESIVMIVLNTIAVSIAPFIWVFVPKLIIDELQGLGRMDYIITILVITLFITSVVHFTKEACIGIYRMKMSRIRMLFGLELHEKGMRLDYHHVENVDTQNLLNRASRTTSSPTNGIGGVMRNSFSIFGYMIGFVGYTGIILSLHPVVLGYLLVSVFIVYKLKLKADAYRLSREDDIRPIERKFRYLTRVMTDFEFGKDTRIYQLKGMLLKKMAGFNHQTEAVQKEIFGKYLKVELIDAILVLLRDGIVYGYIVYMTLSGAMSFGDFILYMTAISGFATWMQELMHDFTELKITARYVDDYRDFMEIDDSVKIENPAALPEGNRLAIDFRNVSFAYPGTEKLVFDGLDLHIPGGQKLAVVGVNGAGKTSLIKLLTGLYRPTQGEITIQGTDIRNIPITEHYKLFSVVYQEIKPLAASIAENVAASEAFDEARVWDAVSRSGLSEKVNRLEKKLDTPLLKVIEDRGLELSGGENQKLALARALYKNGPIVILDEPTAALDPIAEKDIYESFGEMIDGRTAIFISHRLSSTKFCDKVAYFENGKIEEYGTHDELMALDGKYAHMFNTQAQYYQEDEMEAIA
ncbi:MAG TPA: ABC transporter [Clostridiales bacterium UBA8960]|jgi:ATP-binding cassette subfamily C protein|nr:ABC transporter [Clostridiales bacterium UBA8960]